jgi:hypothetical protein
MGKEERDIPCVVPDLDGVGSCGEDCVCPVVVDAATRDVSGSDYFPFRDNSLETVFALIHHHGLTQIISHRELTTRTNSPLSSPPLSDASLHPN